MIGQGSPSQALRRVTFVVAFAFVVSMFSLLATSVVCAQNLPWQQQSYPANSTYANAATNGSAASGPATNNYITPNGMPANNTLPNNTLPNNTLPNNTLPNNTLPNNTLPNNTLPNNTAASNVVVLSPVSPIPPVQLPYQQNQGVTIANVEPFEPLRNQRLTTLPSRSDLLMSSMRSPGDASFSHGSCRVNISWGGGQASAWSGEMRLSNGQMSQMVTLGAEPDVPGTIWLDSGNLNVRSKSPKTYSGVHVTLDGNANSMLQVRFFDQNRKIDVSRTFAIAELAKEALEQMLDETGNRIRIERVPGDELSINLSQRTTFFAPGETLQFEVLPRFMSNDWEKNPTLTVSLFRGRTNDRVGEIETIIPGNDVASARQPIPISLLLPNEEGVFDVVLTLHYKAERLGFLRPGKERVLAQRTFQCLLLSSYTSQTQQNNGVNIGQNMRPDYQGTLIESIDPSNPNWWKRFTKSSPLPLIGNIAGGQQSSPQQSHQYAPFPEPEEEKSTLENVRDRFSSLAPGQLWQRNNNSKGIWQGSLGSGHLAAHQSNRYNTTGLVELQPTFDKNVVAWEAYSIPVRDPGKPHFLEIEYPSGVPQTLGISVIEPSVSGGVFPTTIDSGLHVSEEIVSDNVTGRALQHRILFWPKTREPMILLTNQCPDKPAVYGGLRIYRAPDQFISPSLLGNGTTSAKSTNQQRLFAAYLHRPLFCENFSATRVPGNVPHVGVTDWETFYQGTTRLAQYMRMSGYGGLMVSVASDGSCLYPSRCLEPTPRYDSGVFLSNGEEPVRKDVLGVLATIFDRENMLLIPAIDFCMPLPELEEKIRQNESATHATTPGESGITWVGPLGNAITESFETENKTGRAPYYNLLNPDVQNAMIDVVREVVGRSAKHPSFGGIAIQLSPEGYAMLPEEYWGLDDNTILRFTRDTQIDVPGTGANRFRTRAEFLRTQCLEQWLRWRTAQVAGFYQRMRNVISEIRPDAKLYLAGAKMFESSLSQKMFAPSLTRPGSVYQAMIYHGFDAALYQNDPSIVLMRPERVMATSDLADNAIDLELAHNDMTQVFQQLNQRSNQASASLFYHQPVEQTIPTFDAASPYQPSNAWFSTEVVPAGDQNRKRFIEHLADSDVSSFFDGGCMFPLGEEAATREMMTQFQLLPKILFNTYANEEGDVSTQPVTLRYANTEQNTYCYLINNGSFSVPVKVTFSARPGCRIGALSPSRTLGAPRVSANGFEYSETLCPYDFVAFAISDTAAKPVRVDVSRPVNIIGEGGQINQKVADLTDRINFSSSWLVWDQLVNSHFEMTPADWQQYQLSVAQANAQANAQAALNQTPDKNVSPSTRPRVLTAVPIPPIASIFPGRNSNANNNAKGLNDLSAMTIGNTAQGNTALTNTASSPTQASAQPDGNILSGNAFAATPIPGWSVIGDTTFEATCDSRGNKGGTSSLRLTLKPMTSQMTDQTIGQTTDQTTGQINNQINNNQLNKGQIIGTQTTIGRVVSDDFPAPKTGRLFVSAWVGIPENATDLPVRVTLTGQRHHASHSTSIPPRSATLAPTIWPIISQATPVNGIRWHQVVIPFNDLPLDLDTLAVGFDMYAPGTVWVDEIKLYQLAFTDAERKSLMRIVSVVNYRLNKERVSDTLSILDGYWPQLLEQCIPNVEELRAQRNLTLPTLPKNAPATQAQAATDSQKKAAENDTGVWGRVKKLKWW